MTPNQFAEHDATGLAELIRKGEVSPGALVEAAIEAIAAVDPALHAVVHATHESARNTALAELPEGPFRGVPMVVKDLDGALADAPYTMGTRFLRHYVAPRDGELIARFKRAGFIPVAKTNCPELGILGTTEPEWRGATHNPWNVAHTPGGSSGGSAALVAARAIPVGHAGDGGGSIRIPAAACGLFGMKASRGLLPVGPDAGEGWGGFVSPGALTRSVRDSAAILDALRGPAAGDPYCGPTPARPFVEELASDPAPLRIALCRESLFGRTTHPDCAATLEETAALLTGLGHHVEVARPAFDRDALVLAYLSQVAASVAATLERLPKLAGRPLDPAEFEPPTWFLHQLGHMLSAADLQRSRDIAQTAGRELSAFFQRFDVILLPTMAHPPARLGEGALKPVERFGLGVLRSAPVRPVMLKLLHDLADKSLERVPNTQLFNMTGVPAMSVPLGMSTGGLPIGMQFASGLGRDGLLFQLAGQLERARPWIGRRPAVCV